MSKHFYLQLIYDQALDSFFFLLFKFYFFKFRFYLLFLSQTCDISTEEIFESVDNIAWERHNAANLHSACYKLERVEESDQIFNNYKNYG